MKILRILLSFIFGPPVLVLPANNKGILARSECKSKGSIERWKAERTELHLYILNPKVG
ncbi:MAG: hypothetical protein SWY16_02525 [Cyanobacteriota bacterium]|nr:hypothetical protein [Cyanobacteriota bacterium]